MQDTYIERPPHYTAHVSELLASVRGIFVEDCDTVEMECIQAMVNMLNTIDEIRGYLRGNSFKYHWRYQLKNGLDDLRKAQVYDKWLLKLEETVDAYQAPF